MKINSRLAFLVASAIFFASQVYLTADPFLRRSAPVETDDAYTYILKAEEMRTCFLQDCEALNTLRTQILPAASEETISSVQDRQFHRLFVVYHPLHSILLLGLKAINISYETAYSILAIASKAMICAGIAYWLQAVFGQKTAAMALLMLTPAVFVGTGLHSIVPSTMALGTAFWLWGLITSKHRKASSLLIPLSLVMILFHQTGKVYAAAALGLYVLENRKQVLADSKQRLLVIITTLLIGFSLIAPQLITRPILNFDPTNFYPYEWNWLVELVPGSLIPIEVMRTWFGAFAFPLFGLLLVGYGMYSAWQSKTTAALFMLLILVGQTCLSLLYVVPWFGALLFERAWVPLAVFLTGLVAFGVLSAFDQLRHSLQSVKTSGIKVIPAAAAIAGAILLVAALAAPTYITFYGRHYGLTLANQIERQNFALNPQQPALLFDKLIQPDDLVLYTQELPLYYYLSLGGFDHGAVFLPLVQNTQQAQYWLEERAPEINYLVAMNPVSEPDGIRVDQQLKVEGVNGQDLEASSFSIYVSNPGEAVAATIEWAYGQGIIETNGVVPGSFEGWLEFSADQKASNLIVTVEQPIHVNGLRLSPNDRTQWPWSVGVLLSAETSNGVDQFEVSTSALLPESAWNIEVIDDRGSIVLAKIR